MSGSTLVTLVAVGALVVPAVVAGVWGSCWPGSFERCMAGPHRRWRWRRWARRAWPSLARECGLAVLRDGKREGERVWVHPRLHRPRTSGDTLTLRISARTGQTIEHLEAAAAAIGTAARAVSWRTRPGPPGVLDPRPGDVRRAHPPAGRRRAGTRSRWTRWSVGRRQDNTPWVLPMRGRHTLVVGCSGSGKGSILWGIAAGLAPAVATDTARLWGVDLKRGVEIGMGKALFATVATTPDAAVGVLRRLLAVIDERGAAMAGRTRLHEPSPGDPLHVLVIDELAALTAYADPDIKRDGSRLLAEILTQGRALGVVVLACVQDPRKETVGMRGLFTQTIALRLRSAEETRMVLGRRHRQPRARASHLAGRAGLRLAGRRRRHRRPSPCRPLARLPCARRRWPLPGRGPRGRRGKPTEAIGPAARRLLEGAAGRPLDAAAGRLVVAARRGRIRQRNRFGGWVGWSGT